MRILKFEHHHHFSFGEERMVEVFHILFEYAEEFLDMMVEHFLETDTHETQVIVFYILSLTIFLLFYLLYRIFPRFYFKQKAKLYLLKENTLAEWHALPLIQRFEWWSFFVAYLSYLLFFSF